MPLQQRHLRAVCHILGIFEEPLIEVYLSLPPCSPQVATLIQIGPSVPLQDAPPQDDVCSLVLLWFHGSSKRKATGSILSAEAEYQSVSSATSEIVWLQCLLAEFGFFQSDATTRYARQYKSH